MFNSLKFEQVNKNQILNLKHIILVQILSPMYFLIKTFFFQPEIHEMDGPFLSHIRLFTSTVSHSMNIPFKK
jgi:hypothetical protein